MCLLTLFHNHYSKKFTTFEENSAVKLTEDPFYLSSLFSLAPFKILCFCLSKFDYNVSWFLCPCVYKYRNKIFYTFLQRCFFLSSAIWIEKTGNCLPFYFISHSLRSYFFLMRSSFFHLKSFYISPVYNPALYLFLFCTYPFFHSYLSLLALSAFNSSPLYVFLFHFSNISRLQFEMISCLPILFFF